MLPLHGNDEKPCAQWRSLLRIKKKQNQQNQTGRRNPLMASLDGAAEGGTDGPTAEQGCEAEERRPRGRAPAKAPLHLHRPTRLKACVCGATMTRTGVAVCVSREMLRCGIERAGCAGTRLDVKRCSCCDCTFGRTAANGGATKFVPPAALIPFDLKWAVFSFCHYVPRDVLPSCSVSRFLLFCFDMFSMCV